jgi:hypothetical protein
MADDEVTFCVCRGQQAKVEQADDDPMAFFSAQYHYEQQKRRADLSRKYGIGVWDALEDRMEDEQIERGF